jgi:hypothetical protein
MPTDADHGGGDSRNEWCSNCSQADGTRKTLDECIVGFMAWVQSESCERMGFPRAVTQREARARAESTYLMSPAWKGTS